MVFYNTCALFSYSLLGTGKFIFNLNFESSTFWHMKVSSTEVYLQSYSFPDFFFLIKRKEEALWSSAGEQLIAYTSSSSSLRWILHIELQKYILDRLCTWIFKC